MKRIFSPVVQGYVIANILAFALIALGSLFWKATQNNGTLIFSEFVIIPIVMGIVSAWFWRDLELTTLQLLSHACIEGFIAILLSAGFLKEGIICLLIVCPLLLAFILLGLILGRFMFKRNNNGLNVSVVSLLLLVFITDSLSKHYYQNEVSDVMVVNAPVEKVWPLVVAYKRIDAPSKYWLFQIGMPGPVQSTVTGHQLGAGRKCIFSNGYTFDEKIVQYDVNRNLTFDITNQPRDPEIMGHIDILRGQFTLKDNGNGTTTVTGNSWYRLYVFPTWYYDIWAKSITRNVHLRVMEHIKQLAEQQ